MHPMVLDTPRTRLRLWQETDRPAFAALMADPAVMADLGGPIDRAASDRLRKGGVVEREPAE